MPSYRIFRLAETQRTQFRWAPHTSGVTSVKPKDYNESGAVEAATPYAAWWILKKDGNPLGLGDLLEDPAGALRIVKYVGFEEARWALPEVKTGLEAAPPAAGQPATAPGAA